MVAVGALTFFVAWPGGWTVALDLDLRYAAELLGAGDSAADDVSIILRGARDPDSFSLDDAVEALVQIGCSAVEPLFEMLSSLRVPAVGDTSPQALSRLQEQAILEALSELDVDCTLSALRALSDAATEAGDRSAALLALGAIGSGETVPELLALAAPRVVGEPVEPRVGEAFERALAALLVGTEDALETLEREWSRADAVLASRVVAAIGRAADPRGVELLGELAAWRPDLLPLIAAQTRKLGPVPDPAAGEALAQELAKALDPSDSALCASAVLALGVLESDLAVPRMIELLSEGSEALAADVHWALTRIASLSLPASPSLWKDWYRTESTWFDRKLSPTLVQLSSSDRNDVAAALRDLAGRTLRRHEMARKVSALCGDLHVEIRRLACEALQQLRSPVGRDALTRCLDDPSQHVRAAAQAALDAL